MEMQKAQWTTDGDKFTMGMSISKIDQEQRLVTGWASLDNPDLQGDIVLATASEKAFARFRGNIREMHQPIAVGRMVSYRPDKYYDPETKKFYNGIVVTARVSKGAQDTWEKVLDGTLQAFSIKGPIRDSEMEFSKDSSKPNRVIKDYDLEELSLVDSGGNQYANVISIVKSVDGDHAEGLMTELNSESLFYCVTDKVAKTSNNETEECPHGHKMEVIGWVEYANDEEKSENVHRLVEKYNNTNNDNTQESPANNEGGVDVAGNTEVPEAGSPVNETDAGEQGKAQTEVDASVEETADVDEVSTETEEVNTEVEKAAEVSEVEDAESDLAKTIEGFKAELNEGLEKNTAAVEAALTKLNEQFGEVLQKFDNKINELDQTKVELTEKFAAIESDLGKMQKSIGALEDETAVKKSGDLGGSTAEVLKKSNDSESIWGGHFLSVENL